MFVRCGLSAGFEGVATEMGFEDVEDHWVGDWPLYKWSLVAFYEAGSFTEPLSLHSVLTLSACFLFTTIREQHNCFVLRAFTIKANYWGEHVTHDPKSAASI